MIRINPDLLAFADHHAEAHQSIQPVVRARASLQPQMREKLNIILGDSRLRRPHPVLLDFLRILGSRTRTVQPVGANVEVVAVRGARRVPRIELHRLEGPC